METRGQLGSLKRNVDEVIASIAKMSAQDTDSESIEVEVSTAFAPTEADGDTPMPELTTASDQGSTEVPLASAGVASGDSGFAENLGQLAKALQKLQVDLGTSSAGGARDRANKAAGERRPEGGARGTRGEYREASGSVDETRTSSMYPSRLIPSRAVLKLTSGGFGPRTCSGDMRPYAPRCCVSHNDSKRR
jgi:hypothetical protein